MGFAAWDLTVSLFALLTLCRPRELGGGWLLGERGEVAQESCSTFHFSHLLQRRMG